MNEFALLKDGKIANVVTTPRVQSDVQKMYPGYAIERLADVSEAVKDEYYQGLA